MIHKLLGPSLMISGVKKVHNYLSLRAGAQAQSPNVDVDVCFSDEDFFEMISEQSSGVKKKARLSDREVRNLLSANTKKLTSDQRLVKSVLEEAQISRVLTDKNFKNLEEMYTFRRKYKHYLRGKRLIPLGILTPFTGTELTKMSYAAAIGSKSVSLTLSSVLGFAIPSFFFFHMGYYYAPDKFKPLCQIGKYTLGAPVWIMSAVTDKLMAPIEQAVFDEEVPIDITETAGTIPSNVGDLQQLQDILEDVKKEFSKKTY